MGWKVHVVKLAIYGRLPFRNTLRRIKRLLFGYPPDPGNIQGTLKNLDEIEEVVAKAGRSLVGATVLEIGSGWFPTIPIMLSLRGTQRIILTDLTPHLDSVTFSKLLQFLKPEISRFPGAERKKTLEEFRLEYLAPFRVDSIPNGTIDFIISRTVLEHIQPKDISGLLKQLHPKLCPGGLMIHYIDHSDHLEHKDKSISKINFLTWSVRKHGVVNWLTKEGENRLRHHEYRDLFEKSGYEIVSESTHLHHPTCELARVLPLTERFAKMTPEQVSVLSSIYLLAPRKPRETLRNPPASE